MPVNIINENSRVRLRFVDGVDGFGKDRLISKTYTNVKTAATDEDIYSLAVDLSTLQTKPLMTIIRTDEKEIVE